MATAQRRGFRFPWGGDAHRDEPPPDGTEPEGPDGADPAQPAGSGADELGTGPFGLAGGGPDVEAPLDETAGTTAGSTVEALDLEHAAWPASDRRTVGPLASLSSGRPTADPEAPGETPAPEVPVVTSAPDVPVESAVSVSTAPVEPASTPESESRPEPDAPAAGPVSPSVAPIAPAGRRRDNPLVVGLVRAMRDAARTAREETVSALHADATARTEAIRAQSALAVTELKKVAEADVASIKDWSRAELARVRAETETRIEDRRTQLVAETEAAGQAAEDLLSRLHAAVQAFESEMDRFFDVLLAEDDPARLAGLAEQMPVAPDLEAFPTADAEPVATSAPIATSAPVVDAEPDASPEPTDDAVVESEPAAEAGTAETGIEAAGPEIDVAAPEPEGAEPEPEGAEPETAEPEAHASAPDPEAAAPELDDPRLGWLDHLDSDSAAAAEAEALAGLDRHTNLIVSGLSSVAGIAAFKSSLVHLDGVTAVSVTAGANGDVLFTVTHDGQTDLREAVRGMETFDPHVIADDGDTLSVAAREPAA